MIPKKKTWLELPNRKHPSDIEFDLEGGQPSLPFVRLTDDGEAASFGRLQPELHRLGIGGDVSLWEVVSK
jgi:hypothetical protein